MLIHYSLHTYDFHVRAGPFSKESKSKNWVKIFLKLQSDHPNALRKMVSTIIINYIESKVGILNNFVVLSNRVLKSNVEKNLKYMLQKGFHFMAWVQGKPDTKKSVP